MKSGLKERRKTKVINVGGVTIGGRNPISIQSMTKTDTKDAVATIKQIHQLEDLGCEIIRVAVPDIESANNLPKIIKNIKIPLIADIHFDWRLAVLSMQKGSNGIRINPGNIGGIDGIKEIIKVADKKNISVRIGVNSGSLDKKWLKKCKGVTPEALVGSALDYIKLFERLGFNKLKISLKAPDVTRTIQAYRLISKKVNYPLHAGVTEAGPLVESAVRSSIAIGALLMDGIGDTIRVSVTGDPRNEVIIAKEILQSLGIRNFGPQIISCPTCGRCKVDLIKIVEEFKDRLSAIRYPLSAVKIAIMGCVVNGPGEAKEADIGVACGRGNAVLFRKGNIIKTIPEKEIVSALFKIAFSV